MTDDGDEIELPRHVRPIGVAGGPVAGSPIALHGRMGVLPPFAGVLDPVAQPGDRPGSVPAFSYLVLRPLVVERPFGRAHGPDRTRRVSGEPDRPEATGTTGTTEEPRVREVLRATPSAGLGRPRQGVDREPTGDSRPVLRSEPDGRPAPPREVAVLATADAGGRDPDPVVERADRVRDVTVLGDGRLTLLERPTADTPSPVDRTRGTATDPDGDPTRDTRPPVGGAGVVAGPLTRLLPPTTTAGTNPTVGRPAPGPAAPGADPAAPLTTLAGGTTAGRGDGPRDETRRRGGPGPRSDPVPGAARVRLGGPGSPAGRGPDMTVVAAGVGEGPRSRAEGARRPRSDVRTARDGTALDGEGTPLDATDDRPPGPTGRAGPERRPGQETTMAALLDDTTEMNRLVDRLYREFQRKSRIERERRGL